MPNPARTEPARIPELYRLVGYDPGLETHALERLSGMDLVGCRERLLRLVRQLDFRALGDQRGAEISLLLLDVLQRVNRRVHASAERRATGEQARASLIRRFASCRDAETARRRFPAALDRLLKGQSDLAASVHPLVEKASAFVEQHYALRLSLSSLARSLHVSPGYLSRLFRRETGLTVTAFVHRVRLENARPLLAQEERTLSEIAYRVGYRNYRDFYRNFVKQERASPRQVRRRLSRSAGARAS